jgi:cytochrome P450
MFSSKVVEGVPVIPGSHFLFGHLPLMGTSDDFRVVQHKLSVEHADENGRCCFWMGPTTPALSVSHAKDVQAALKSTAHRAVFPLMLKHLEECFGKRNIGVLTGKEWRANRLAIVNALHATAARQSHTDKMTKATRVMISSLTASLEHNQHQHFEIGRLMKLLTMDIFGQTALSKDFGCCEKLELSPVAAAFEFLTSDMMRRVTGILDPTNYFYSLPMAKNKRHHRERTYLKLIVQELIVKRQEELKMSKEVPRDLLTNLINVQQEFESKAEGSDHEQALTDALMGLLFAGYETTSVTLTYAIFLVSQNGQAERNCLEEMNRLKPGPTKTASVNPDDLIYSKAVILETLRLYPPAISTTRSLDRQLDLDGISVEKGTYLYIPIWFIQRHDLHRNGGCSGRKGIRRGRKGWRRRRRVVLLVLIYLRPTEMLLLRFQPVPVLAQDRSLPCKRWLSSWRHCLRSLHFVQLMKDTS